MANRLSHATFASVVFAFCFATAACACNIPVFRYALERWKPDLCEVIVFHDIDLSASQNSLLVELQNAANSSARQANLEIIRSRVGQDPNRQNADLWLSLKAIPNVVLPYVVVRTSVSDKKYVNGWHGSFDQFRSQQLLDSPARRELSRRLLTGDSVVWLMLKSSDPSRNSAAMKLLTEELAKLSKSMQFPDGLGLPGSELFAEIPLLMKFTVLEINPEDRDEQFLVSLFRGFQPKAAAGGEPLLIPVFGRGRALEVIPADQLDAGTINDLTRYLCGACSCQVKERNPGFDLLLSTQWERELFGENGPLPPPAREFDATQSPKLLTIPPGKAPRNSVPSSTKPSSASGKTP